VGFRRGGGGDKVDEVVDRVAGTVRDGAIKMVVVEGDDQVIVAPPARSAPSARPAQQHGGPSATRNCSTLISLRDPTTGETIAINVLRDQAAMDAFQALSK
jgi:hypothetical protein